MAAFAFAKYNFRGKDGLFILTLAMIMIPLQVILIPMYLVVSSLGLVNTYWGMIIPAAATPTGVFVIRQYMLTIPDELLESARMDGAGEFRIYARIVMPLARPALAVVAIFSILWRWNDFLWPLLIAQEERLYTLPVALALLNGQLVGTTTGTTIMQYQSTPDERLGATDNYWKGDINMALIYKRGLSSAEILQNFNAIKSRFGL